MEAASSSEEPPFNMASMPGAMHDGASNCGGASVPSLIDLCIEAVLAGGLWKYQRRSLERLPSPFVERLFQRLLSSRQLSPPLLECVTSLFLFCKPILDCNSQGCCCSCSIA